MRNCLGRLAHGHRSRFGWTHWPKSGDWSPAFNQSRLWPIRQFLLRSNYTVAVYANQEESHAICSLANSSPPTNMERQFQPERIHPTLTATPDDATKLKLEALGAFESLLYIQEPYQPSDRVTGYRSLHLSLADAWYAYQGFFSTGVSLQMVLPVTFTNLFRRILGQAEVNQLDHTWRYCTSVRANEGPLPIPLHHAACQDRHTLTKMTKQLLHDMTTHGQTPTPDDFELATMIYARTHAWVEMEELWHKVSTYWIACSEERLQIITPEQPYLKIYNHFSDPTYFRQHILRLVGACIYYYARAQKFRRCQALLGEVEFRYGVRQSRFILSTLLQAYANVGRMVNALAMRRELESAGWTLSYREFNALLAGEAIRPNSNGVDALLEELEASTTTLPNYSTYHIVINHYLNIGDKAKARHYLSKLWQYLPYTGAITRTLTIRQLIDQGLITEAEAPKHLTPSFFTKQNWNAYTVFIRRCLYTNHPDSALRAYKKLATNLMDSTSATTTPPYWDEKKGHSAQQLKLESAFLLVLEWLARRQYYFQLQELVCLGVDHGLLLSPTGEIRVRQALREHLPARLINTLWSHVERLFPSTRGEELVQLIHDAFLTSPSSKVSVPPSKGSTKTAVHTQEKETTALPRTQYTMLLAKLASQFGMNHAVAFDTVIKLLVNRKNYQQAQDFFTHMVADGTCPSPYVYTLMIKALVRCGQLEAVEQLRHQMETQFNMQLPIHAAKSLLAGYVRHHMSDQADQLFSYLTEHQLELPSFSATLLTHRSPHFQPSLDLEGYTVIMQMFNQRQELEFVEYCFSTMQKAGIRPDVKAYNVMLACYCQSGDVVQCIQLYRTMVDRGLCPTPETAFTLLKCCAMHGTVTSLSTWYNDLVRREIRLTTPTYNHILQRLVRTPVGLKIALLLFERMWHDSVPQGTEFTPTKALYARDHFVRRDSDLYQQWMHSAIQNYFKNSPHPTFDEDTKDLSTADGGEERRHNLRSNSRQVHLPFRLPPRCYTHVVPPCPNSLTFKILIRAAAKRGHWTVVTGLFELQRNSMYFSPDLRTYGWAITAFSKLGDHATAMKYWSEFQSAPSFQVAQSQYHWTSLQSVVDLNMLYTQKR
ncbi:hypothetical protein IWQ61_004630 [Dispira simplex]|nr:hypothetical protein IWQ61_004630 [Dispira simplex]